MAYLSKLTEIQINDSPVVEIPQVSNINVTRNKETVDVTHLLSTAKEFLAGFSEGGVSFEMNYQPGDAANDRLVALYDGDTVVSFTITFPQPSPPVTMTFNALVENLGDVAAVGDKLSRSVSLKVSGAITEA